MPADRSSQSQIVTCRDKLKDSVTRAVHPFVATFTRRWDIVRGCDHVLANVATKEER